MSNGKVKWFNETKGYGFISPLDGGNDVFVHISALEESGLRTLKENDTVSYEIQNKGGKISAIDIKRVK